MKKIFILLLIFSISLAGEGLPVLTFPDLAQEGYFPQTPVKAEKGVTFSYANWYYATDYSAISAKFDGYDIGFKGLVSDNIEIRGEVPTDDPVGTTAYYNTTLYVGKRFDLNDKWMIKAKASLLSERLFYASSWGGALDAEVARTFNVMWRALAGVENLGWMSPLNTIGTQLPTRYYAGGDLILNFLIISVKTGINSDIEPFFRWGIKYFHPVFELTYSHDNLQNIHHVGAELKLSKFRIGYGQYFHQGGLGYPMMFSFGMTF